MATAKTPQSLLQKAMGKPEEGEVLHIIGHNVVEGDLFYAPTCWYSSGIEVLDGILGNGGFGGGRIVEVYGPERTGKSELARICAQTFLRTNEDGICVYYDQERALDPAKIDADPVFSAAVDRMVVRYAPTAENLFQRLHDMLETISKEGRDVPCLVVIDSLAALMTKAELEGDIGDQNIAPLARIIGPALKKLRDLLQGTNTLLFIVNQVRSSIGKGPLASDESPGGKALKFWADYRIKTTNKGVWRLRPKKKDEEAFPDGLVVSFRTIKNKLAPPLRDCEIPLAFGSFYGAPAGFSDCWSKFELLKGVLFKVAGGRYKWMERSGLADAETWEKHEWPMMCDRHATIVQAGVKKWSDEVLLRTLPDSIPADEDDAAETPEPLD